MSLPLLSQTLREKLRICQRKNLAVLVIYLTGLGAVSYHLYGTPIYRMDAIQYMGNALLMDSTDIVKIHQQVYSEVGRSVPEPERGELLGHQPGAPLDQNRSRELRSRDAYRYGEFLPLFAIRPLYNQLIYLSYKSGVGLLRSTVLIAASSYFLLGVIIFVWMYKFSSSLIAAVLSLLVMLSSPMLSLGRENISDGAATLVAFAALYLILENKPLVLGLSGLLAAIYFRTDFVVLALPALALCWLKRRITLWQATVLGVLAVVSTLLINYCAGDYGIRMLYYRNFVGTPSAPGEMTALFSLRDYISGLESGVRLAAGSFFIPFLLLGLAGALRATRARGLFLVAVAYSVMHFAVLPNWQERWFAMFYLSMGVVAAMSLGRSSDLLSFPRDAKPTDAGNWKPLRAEEAYTESASEVVAGA